MSITENISIIRERIANAAENAGIDQNKIKLIAVTKTVDTDKILRAISSGITDIGENYVQNAIPKHSIIQKPVTWHMIGHLQKNKVKQAISIFDMIQSVDSLALANEIGKRSIDVGKTTDILIEVNISGEQSKTGINPEITVDICDKIADVKGVKLCGLMGIAAFTDDESQIRKSFALLRGLWERLPADQARWLSMGMTSDFEMAIKEGSNMVRIGTAIFGSRV